MQVESGVNGVLEALVAALRARAHYNHNEQIAPAAILWPDKERQWDPLLPALRERLPALLTLGPYQPDTRTGPAIWLRCMLARTLKEANWDETEVPILYLPGISRQELRAVESCPPALQPLAELQYRGEFWCQLNGRDWTLYAFLISADGGLGLDVARDHQTQAALTRALLAVATTPIDQLRGRRLEAEDFDALLSGDTVRDLLDWLNQPMLVPDRWGSERWAAFCARCQSDYDLNPKTDGELTGAERLSERKQPSWAKVWERFAEAPERYPNIPNLLEKVVPQALFTAGETLPQRNREAEQSLRQALKALADLPPHEATSKILALETEHGGRRRWVWARLKQAPLAQTLAPLSRLASIAGVIPNFSTLEEAAQYQKESGFQADAAVLDALQCVRQDQDVQAVFAAIRSVYGTWLQETAQRLQKRVAENGYPAPTKSAPIPPGTCVLFADGLRLDVGQKLVAQLERRGLTVRTETCWAALPTVTATAKPALSPVAALISGLPDAQDFQPCITANGKPSIASNFRKLLTENEWQVLDPQETGAPAGKAWTEYGSLDRYGHDQGWKLAWRIDEELAGLVGRIGMLLEAGWKQVQVQTDHGWLLYPGGLPKQDMPGYLTQTRWGRCAHLKEEATYEGPMVTWHWCDEMRIALPRGIGVFYAGEYSHGGLSLQECLVPRLAVVSDASSPQSTLEEPLWRGLRCRVTVENAESGMRVDLRTKPADASSSLAGGGKTLDEEGKTSLLVADDEQEGTVVSLVLIDMQERVVAKLVTTVGGE
jgi:hypothetical protein